MGENMIVIKDLKTFCFNFNCSKDVDENLKYEIESSAENEIKNEIE